MLLCLIALASAGSAAVAAPSVTLVDPAARLDYRQSDGEVKMVLQVDGLDADQLQDPALLKIEQLPGDSSPFKVNSIEPLGPPGPAAKSWLVSLQLGGLPANTTQKRYLSVTIAGKATALEYTLTNKAAETFSWTVRAPPTIAIEPGQPIPIMVAVGPVPANKVVLAGPYLGEKTTKALIAPNGLILCRSASDDCHGGAGDRIALQANSMTQLWLRGAAGIGQYEGTVTIACDEKPEGDVIALSIQSTTAELKFFGVAVIFVSALLTWFITVFARNLINRDQMLLPVERLRGRLATLQTRVATHPTNPPGIATPGFDATIARLLDELGEAQLAPLGLPGRIPSPWSATPASNQTDAYRNALQCIADWLAVLETICGDGFAVIWSKWDGATQAQQLTIIQATTALDSLATPSTPPTLDTVRQQIVSRVAAVNGALALGGAPPAPVVRPTDHLNWQIAQISMAAWIIVLLGTTLVGSIALVLNSSFGSLMDFATCVAWGLGLPIGSQAMNASFGTAGTSLGISMQR